MILYAEVPDFYATLERARRPELGDRALIVGGDPEKRGTVQSASEAARRAGVVSGMPMRDALSLCPSALSFKTDMSHYREVSGRLRACLRSELGALEPDALESGYLDVSHLNAPASRLGERAIERVRETLALPLRVGIARVKFLARLAAEEAAAGEVHAIEAAGERAFLSDLAVDRLPGVGPKTRETLRRLGAQTVGALRTLDRRAVESALGNHGLRVLAHAEGREDAVVQGQGHPRSLSREHTFPEPQHDLGEMWECLQRLSNALGLSLQEQGLAGARVIVKVRFADEQTTTRSHTPKVSIEQGAVIYAHAVTLLDKTAAGTRPVRLLGVGVSGLEPRGTGPQLDLFS